MSEAEWETDELPDFTVHGFHTGRKVRFVLSNGRTFEDVYQGWGIFGKGDNEYNAAYANEGDVHVVAWQPIEDDIA